MATSTSYTITGTSSEHVLSGGASFIVLTNESTLNTIYIGFGPANIGTTQTVGTGIVLRPGSSFTLESRNVTLGAFQAIATAGSNNLSVFYS